MKISKRQIPGYELMDVIASGGMGTVFKAHQSSLDKTVALKVLSPALARDKNYVERFVREAKSLAKLNHPNVVTVIDVGRAGEHYYLVMEYVEGRTLAEIIDEQGPLPEREALSIIRNVACALEHAQRHNLIHRDIKPDNVLLSSEGHCKLCDLGLARHAGGSSDLTAAGVAMGTPEYIAPEQARGMSDLDIRTDIYSLGATLYDALTGRAPFDGPTPAHIMRAHIDDPLSFPESPSVSQNLRELIEKMMAKDPAQRQQSARELTEDIDLVLAGKRIRKKPGAVRQSALHPAVEVLRRHSVIFGCALCAALAAIIMLAFLIPAPSSEPREEEENAVRKEEESTPSRPRRERGRDRMAQPVPVRKPVNPGRPSEIPPEAKVAYDAAVLLESNPAAKVDDVIRAFRAVADKYPDTSWGEKALARAEELESRRDRLAMEAQEQYGEVEALVTNQIREKKYHEALLGLTRFALRHEGTPSARKARWFARQLVASAAKYFAHACSEAQKLTQQGDYEGARRILTSLKQTGVPELDEIISEKLRDLSRQESDANLARKATDRSRLYKELLLELFDIASRGDIEDALARIADARREKKYSLISDLMQQEETDLRNALPLLSAAEEGLRTRKGSTESLLYRNGGTVWGKILDVWGGTVTIAPEGDANRSATIRIMALDDRQIANLAAYCDRPIPAADKLFFYLARGNVEEAAGALDKIPSAFSGRARLQWKLLLLKAMAHEKDAESLAAEVSGAYRAKRFASAALSARELFEKYAGTSFLIENAATMGQYVPQPGLLRVYSKSSFFKSALSADVDLVPSFTINRQLVEPRGVLHVRWEGVLNVPVDGEYTFYIMANGSVCLKLGGRKLIRESMGPEVKIVSDERKLRKGLTEIEIEVACPRGNSAIVQVLWQREGGRRLPLTPADVSHLPARHAEYQEKTK